MPYRGQNNSHVTWRTPSYYANNNLYPDSYTQNAAPTRTSRRVHDGLSLSLNYGLDTVSDDINSSPYSSPFYINGRYNSDNLITQRANSASVQGNKKVLIPEEYLEREDFTADDVQTSIEMWQGKQIKFELPYDGKIVGQTIEIKNTNGCTGILSIYLSATDGGPILSETAVDLCKVSEDKFDHIELFSNTVVPRNANPRGKVFVRLEIWDEISMERSENPFNTGRKIEIQATGKGNHYACEYTLGPKNLPVVESYNYDRRPSRPLLGLIYSDYESVPVLRQGTTKYGAVVSLNGYRYNVFCIKDGSHAEVLIHDHALNTLVSNEIRVDGRLDHLCIAQVKDTVYYDDGYSPFQKFKIGEWVSSVTPDQEGDEQPVVGANILLWHNSRIWRAGFKTDPNLVQYSIIDGDEPKPEQQLHRFYAPDEYPQETSITPITAIVELDPEHIFITGTDFASQYETNASADVEGSIPEQVPLYTDGIGVQSQGDICNFQGTIYSFDTDEGIRRFNGTIWQKLPTTVDSHYDRVDMARPRKLWGYSNKLYFNYYDKFDGKAKALIWDKDMNYQQYPWFQDYDLPFCDVRNFDDFNLLGIHPDYPCIMNLYAEDTWARLDSPIVFQRDTKYLSLPGNAADMIVRRVHNKVIANSNRWWWFGLSADKQSLEQARGDINWYRMPCWDTITESSPIETPFPFEDEYEENSIIRLTLSQLRIKCSAIQEKIKCKTFRSQANLVSTLFESAVRQYL